jgi:hypothetical protein
MTAQEVISHLYEAGLSVALQKGEIVNLKPTNLVTTDLVSLVKVNKQALIDYFKEGDATKTSLAGFHPIYDGDPLLGELLHLGNQICNYWEDSEFARAEMRSDMLSYPTHQRAALMTTLEGSLRTDEPRRNFDGSKPAIGNTKF